MTIDNLCGIQIYNQLGFATGNSNLQIAIGGDNTGTKHRIELVNIEGKKVIFGDQFTGNNYEINSNLVPPGVYIIKVTSGDSEKTKKLIKFY